MSNTFSHFELLMLFGKIRRQLNLKATQVLKPSGIGPKQALVLRELGRVKIATPIEIARNTGTDPTATGKIIETLIQRNWVKKTDNPNDRRSWQVSLNPNGLKAARSLEKVYLELAEDFCKPLSSSENDALFKLFNKITTHLEAL